MRPVVAVSAACGAGALDPGCEAGPAVFQQYWDRGGRLTDAKLTWEQMPQGVCTGETPLDAVARTGRWLAETTRRLAEGNRRLVVIGGDHSCAIGTWSGVSMALRPLGSVGLIWIDAHMDMHLPATTHSGAVNGMPVAALVGHGAPELIGLAGGRSAIDPRHICLVGARSFESEETAFASKHKIRVIGMDEVARCGVEDALAEAREIASGGIAGFGVSLDLDAFDPTDAPGVGTPEPGGIRVNDFLGLWSNLIRGAACRGVEIVEYNPRHDQGNRTARLMTRLVATIVGGERQWAD
jgi:arginase